MARLFDQQTLNILKYLFNAGPTSVRGLYLKQKGTKSYKEFYNIIFRLHSQELVKKSYENSALHVAITEAGQKLLRVLRPEKDGVWKLIIFDIPEKHKYVRTVLRAKLKSLGFKKWQNSIWVSPFALDPDIEAELNELGKKFFVRLLRVAEINHKADLEKMFA